MFKTYKEIRQLQFDLKISNYKIEMLEEQIQFFAALGSREKRLESIGNDLHSLFDTIIPMLERAGFLNKGEEN